MAKIRRNGWFFGPSKEELAASKQKQANFYADTIRRKLEMYDAPYKAGDKYKEIGKHSAQDMVQGTWRDFQSKIFLGEPYQMPLDEVVEIGRELFDKRQAVLQRLANINLKRNPAKRGRPRRNPTEAITEIPNMHKYESEQNKARLTAAFIGHRLGTFQPASQTSMVAGCERCGATVTISGKDASGLAVVGKCIA
jgi:hypothetical protein